MLLKYKSYSDRLNIFSHLFKVSNSTLILGQDEGAFTAEIAPFTLKIKGKDVDFAVDEHPK